MHNFSSAESVMSIGKSHQITEACAKTSDAQLCWWNDLTFGLKKCVTLHTNLSMVLKFLPFVWGLFYWM